MNKARVENIIRMFDVNMEDRDTNRGFKLALYDVIKMLPLGNEYEEMEKTLKKISVLSREEAIKKLAKDALGNK